MNYSDQFWSNMFSISLERPKPNISMISGFLDPCEPLRMDLNIPKHFQTYKKYENRLKQIVL